MANPRRNPIASSSSETNHSSSSSSSIGLGLGLGLGLGIGGLSFKLFMLLKKPLTAFPFLLSIFLLLTWLSLALQHQHAQSDHQSFHSGDKYANLIRFSSSSNLISKDKRGWLLNPISLALDAHLSGGALSCASLHLGQITPRGLRGNHRHYACNETFVIWGATTKFRLERTTLQGGYAEATIAADEVAVAASPSGTAHALINLDPVRTSYFIGCQDATIDYNTSTTDFNVWDDL